MEFKYRGLRARLEHVDVTDEEVTRQLVRLQQQSQRRTPVFDRPSQNGDELVLDYAGFADGQQFAGGTAEAVPPLPSVLSERLCCESAPNEP